MLTICLNALFQCKPIIKINCFLYWAAVKNVFLSFAPCEGFWADHRLPSLPEIITSEQDGWHFLSSPCWPYNCCALRSGWHGGAHHRVPPQPAKFEGCCSREAEAFPSQVGALG